MNYKGKYFDKNHLGYHRSKNYIINVEKLKAYEPWDIVHLAVIFRSVKRQRIMSKVVPLPKRVIMYNCPTMPIQLISKVIYDIDMPELKKLSRYELVDLNTGEVVYVFQEDEILTSRYKDWNWDYKKNLEYLEDHIGRYNE